MDKIREDTRLQLVIAVILVSVLLAGSYWIVNRDSNKEKLSKVPLDGSISDIISSDPVETAASFIKANGTMGNIEKDITFETLKNGTAIFENIDRRMIALSKVESAVVPGSPIINGSERKHIEIHSRNLIYPILYEVKNIKAGKPKNSREISVADSQGKATYQAVDIEVSFDSVMTTFTRAGDTSYDGTNTQTENKDQFDVTVTLAQSGDLWFVYDIENSEYLLNERFATWKGIGPSTVKFSENKDVGYMQIPGIIPIEEDSDNE